MENLDLLLQMAINVGNALSLRSMLRKGQRQVTKRHIPLFAACADLAQVRSEGRARKVGPPSPLFIFLQARFCASLHFAHVSLPAYRGWHAVWCNLGVSPY